MGQTSASPRSGMVNIRIRPADRTLIDQAAAAAGKSRTEFMLEAARRAAEEALLDRTLIRVDEPTFQRFVEMLDAPPQPSEGLRRLMQRKPAWE